MESQAMLGGCVAPKHALRGVPDIILIKPPHGQFVKLEVKQSAGRLSPEQLEFQAATNARGAAYVVRSVEDVRALGL